MLWATFAFFLVGFAISAFLLARDYRSNSVAERPILLSPSVQKISVHAIFQSIFAIYQTQLGEPAENARDSLPAHAKADISGAYQEFFEHAMSVFLRDPGVTYIFPRELGKPYIRFENADYADAAQWWDLERLREQFKTPAGLNPPTGDLARRWAQDPDQYQWIGSSIRGCTLEGGRVMSQRFQKGVLIGVLRRSIEGSPDGQIIAAFDDGIWNSRAANEQAPACISLHPP